MKKINFTGLKPLTRNLNHNSTDYYLERLGEMFDCIEAYSTAGDIRPPYAFQYVAKSNLIIGDDDIYEGKGGTPHKAVKDLFNKVKLFLESDINYNDDYSE
jgi:hypothetical protein